MAKRAATSDGRSPASTSTIRPCAGVSPCGRLVISTITLSPSFAPCAERAAISTEYQCPGSSGSTRPFPTPACQMPPMRLGASPMRRIRRATAAAALVHSDGAHLDPIAVHQTRRVGPRQQQRPRGIIRYHEHVAVGAASHEPRQTLGFAGGGKSLRPLDRLPVAHHGGEALRQGVALLVGTHSEALRQALRAQRLGCLREVLEQQLTARDRIVVALLLELEVRILGTPIARLVARLVGIWPGLLWRARIFAAAACHGLEIPRNRKMREVNSFAP